MSLSFSFSALMAFFRVTLAWVMTSSMSLSSIPVASTSSPSSSSSSSLASSCLWSWLWSWPAWSCSAVWLASCWAAAAWALALRSSILASPKTLCRGQLQAPKKNPLVGNAYM